MKKLVSAFVGYGLNGLSLFAPATAGKIGFKLFCYPLRGKLAQHHKEFLHTAERFDLNAEGERVQIYKWGTGACKVLFLHGWQSHTYRWKNHIEALDKKKFTVYALDAPGHGLSSGNFLTVPLYGAVVSKLLLRVGTVDVMVSHSLGGFTSLYLAHIEPSLAPKKLVVMASPGEAKEFFEFYSSTLNLSQRMIDLTVNHFEKLVGKAPDYFSASSFASHLTIPGLIIHDEDDTETSVENSRSIHQVWKNSQLIITKGKGHNLKSAELIAEVVNFIEQSEINSGYSYRRT
jgi:pimeloyl-ACP methyl ester carboxylesterase